MDGNISAKDLKYLRWAHSGAQIFSTCGKAKYMAIVVDRFGHVVGTGYNGGPKGMIHCEDGGCPRLQECSAPGSSYDNCIAIHAEDNALLHSDYTQYREGGTIYVTGAPCFGCAKKIANSGLRRCVYLEDGLDRDPEVVRQFLEMSGVELVGCTL